MRALAGAGLTEQDVKFVLLQHPDGRTALRRGDVDAWAGLDPMMASAELEEGAVLFYRQPEANTWGILNVPPLPAGMHYENVAMSSSHTVALRSDGAAIAFGANVIGECNIPPLPSGLRYVQVGVSERKTVLRRSDGAVLCVGDSSGGQLLVPDLDQPGHEGRLRVIRGEAGVDAPVLLRHERLDLAFAVDDEFQGDGLDAAGAGARLDLAVEQFPHIGASRVGEEASVTQGSRAKFHPSLEPADNRTVRNQASHSRKR